MSKHIFKFSATKRKHDRCEKIINDFTDTIIRKKVAELKENASVKNNVQTNNYDDDEVYKKPKTFIETLLTSDHQMSHAQIRDEIQTIIVGKKCNTKLYLYI